MKVTLLKGDSFRHMDTSNHVPANSIVIVELYLRHICFKLQLLDCPAGYDGP